MVDFTNIGRIAKFSSSNETVGLVDGTDAIHSGLLKAIEAWSQGNYLIPVSYTHLTLPTTPYL